jgi:hypothetical protein
MKKRERRKEGLGGRKRNKKWPAGNAGFGRKKRRKEGLVII